MYLFSPLFHSNVKIINNPRGHNKIYVAHTPELSKIKYQLRFWHFVFLLIFFPLFIFWKFSIKNFFLETFFALNILFIFLAWLLFILLSWHNRIPDATGSLCFREQFTLDCEKNINFLFWWIFQVSHNEKSNAWQLLEIVD